MGQRQTFAPAAFPKGGILSGAEPKRAIAEDSTFLISNIRQSGLSVPSLHIFGFHSSITYPKDKVGSGALVLLGFRVIGLRKFQ